MAALLFSHYVFGFEYPEVRTTVFTTLVLTQLVHAVNVRTGGGERVRLPGGLLLGAILSSAFLQVVIIYTELGNTLFRTVPLSGESWLIVGVATTLSMLAVRALKVILWKRS